MARYIEDRLAKKAKSSQTNRRKKERRKKAIEDIGGAISSDCIEISEQSIEMHIQILENEPKSYPHGFKEKLLPVPYDFTSVVKNDKIMRGSKNGFV